MAEPIQGVMTSTWAEALGYKVFQRQADRFERELCRILVAEGFEGSLELADADTDAPRMVIADIRRLAAKLDAPKMTREEALAKAHAKLRKPPRSKPTDGL